MTKYYFNWRDQLIVAKEISSKEPMISVNVLYSEIPRLPANTRQKLLSRHWHTQFINADSRAKKIKIINWKFKK